MNSTNNHDNIAEKQKKILWIQRSAAILFVCIVAVAFITCYIKYGKQIYNLLCDFDSLKTFLAPFKGYDRLVFVGIRAFQTVIKIIPAEPLEIGSGLLYGTWGGLLYCLLGTEIGSLVIILLTKIFGRKIVDLFVPIDKLDSLKFLQNEKKVYTYLFIIYLIPGTPKDIITYVAGITKMNMPKFLLITGIARIPSIITSTMCGEQIMQHNYNLAVTIFALTLLAGIIGSVIYKKYSEKKNNEDNVK